MPGVTLLNVDPGAETNRTVITFVGAPEAALEGAMASGGYPGKYQTGFPISGLDKLDKGIKVFHAGTALKGGVVTSGGSGLTVAANGKSIAEACSKIYANISRIQFEGCHYWKDIAAREVK